MRPLSLGLVGLFSISALAAVACGSSVSNETSQSTSGAGGDTGSTGSTMSVGSAGVGGAGGAGTTTASSTAASTGASSSSGSVPGYPAAHTPLPDAVSLGGPVLAAPKLIPVFFTGDDPTYVQQTTDFFNKVGPTNWWAAATAEYGVGPATSGTPIQAGQAMAGTITDASIQQWLAQKLASDPQFSSQLGPNSVYGLVYPKGVTISLPNGGMQAYSCQQFGGYHQSIKYQGQNVAYMVLPRCANFDNITGIDALTAATSHEMVEAATDPYPNVVTAYGQVDDLNIYWLFALGGGEVADLCAQSLDSFYKDPQVGYTVQRSWSNKAAKASHDPCQPAPAGEVYFNSAPVFPDKMQLNGGGDIYTVQGVNIPVGGTKTIELDLYSDGPTAGPWNIQADDFFALQGGTQTLNLSLDKKSGVNGDKVNLTIHVTQKSPYGVGLFLIRNQLGNQTSFWIGLVGS